MIKLNLLQMKKKLFGTCLNCPSASSKLLWVVCSISSHAKKETTSTTSMKYIARMLHLRGALKRTPLAGCLISLCLHSICHDEFIPWGSKGCSLRHMNWISGPTEMSRGEAGTCWLVRNTRCNPINTY